MARLKSGFAVLTLMAFAAGVRGGVAFDPEGARCWSIASPPGKQRWIEIHHRAPGRAAAIYHVQVFERDVGSPRWKFRSLADHLAITETALRASVSGVAKEKAAYPESYSFSYEKWKTLDSEGKAPVCETEVMNCL